ncbi:dTDP-4-dehydrorhamnose 3,5-epimerase [Flavobacteriaceae bacterium]|jgi:dTDP-4-dehydrorhamnose 3,5-epimerase|nr:dTDP-4-dehydrorhamnose 3,5-epimerase [Flavobacteriaceae bacterium]MDA9124873.1 dTDP-4-dehydrorhamnose 3,5-epimerase [Flavobacteriaceae bacterium]MDA9323411.1 dTDP-4-dehydrorhamnose 3,5-epimerase [Flavobacteriaceae bacterium]MDB4060136.1 dTDP-4-dehydrorhamnose 3,5-epimerase [Flavobacteriaceae bacterium]MDB9787367.1 dTDP-4-dehydrorhamnose 3,5-epimerase [Flavobacteriaceae bacterium]
MKINKTFIEDLLIIEPQLFKDERGFFYESYNKNNLDINIVFVQDNESKSYKGVIRGLHFQTPPFEQTKLVRCVSGNILDVAVDLRTNSKTYGKSFSIELSSENNRQLFVPKGFAHGFQVLSEIAIVSYKVDNYYNPDSDSGLIWNDKDLSIDWNLDLKPILSKKDLKLISFKELKSPF